VGAEYHLLKVIRHLDRNRFLPFVGCLKNRNGIGAQIEQLGIPVYDFSVDQIYHPRVLYQGHRLRALLRQYRIHILHTYLDSANVFGPLQALPLSRELKVIISRRDDGFGLSQRLALLQRWLAVVRVDLVTTVSEHIRRMTIKEWRLPPHKVVAIHNGVALPGTTAKVSLKQFRADWNLPTTARIIACVGRLNPVKGLDLLLGAAPFILAHFPDVFFFLIGEGKAKTSLRQQIENLGIADRVIFTGHQNELSNFYRAMDVLVNSSYTEGISNSILEAMSYGKAVVAAAVGGTPEIIEHGRTGLLFRARDPEILAGLLIQLLAQPEWLQELGTAASERIKQQFSIAQMMAKLQVQYLRLVNQNEKPVIHE